MAKEFRQQHQHPGGMVRLDHRQHDGDGLGIFVLQVAGENLLADISELVPHGAAGRAADFLHDLGDAVPGQGLQQQALGALEAAEDAAGGAEILYEVDAEILDGIGGDGAKLGHGGGDRPDLVLMHHAEQLAGMLLAEREHQDRCLMKAGHLPVRQAARRLSHFAWTP